MSLLEFEEIFARLDKLEKEVKSLWEMFAIRKAWRLHSKDHAIGGLDEIKNALPITAYPEAILKDGSRALDRKLGIGTSALDTTSLIAQVKEDMPYGVELDQRTTGYGGSKRNELSILRKKIQVGEDTEGFTSRNILSTLTNYRDAIDSWGTFMTIGFYNLLYDYGDVKETIPGESAVIREVYCKNFIARQYSIDYTEGWNSLDIRGGRFEARCGIRQKSAFCYVDSLIQGFTCLAYSSPYEILGDYTYEVRGGFFYASANDLGTGSVYGIYCSVSPGAGTTYARSGYFEGAPVEIRDELLVKSYVKSGSVDTLPTPSAKYRGKMVRIEGGTGVADKLYICIKDELDNYVWKEVNLT